MHIIEETDDMIVFSGIPIKPKLPEILKDLRGKSVLDDDIYKAYKEYERQYDNGYGKFVECVKTHEYHYEMTVRVEYEEEAKVFSKVPLEKESYAVKQLFKQMQPSHFDIDVENLFYPTEFHVDDAIEVK